MVSALDRARGRPVEASSAKSAERSAGKAVDGDAGSRWTSLYSDHQWLAVDLGEPYMLARIEIRWEKACAQTYLLQGSLDNKTWATFKTETGHEGWVRTALPPDCRARWVRMYGQKRATSFGFSIWDLRVFSLDNAPDDAAAAERARNRPVLPRLPTNVATDAKWFVWNVVWEAANKGFAANGPEDKREQRIQRAVEDSARGEGHFQAALATDSLSTETLEHLRKRAQVAGHAAAAAAITGTEVAALGPAKDVAPRELEKELWVVADQALVLAARNVAVALRKEIGGEEKGHLRVVGGEPGGLEVRVDSEQSSDLAGERLAPGAVIKQLSVKGDRLHFSKISGEGPQTGWIAVREGRTGKSFVAPESFFCARQARLQLRSLQAEFEMTWQRLCSSPGTPPKGLPPRPLTSAWLAVHVLSELTTVEEALPAELDHGMASVCTLLRVGMPEDRECELEKTYVVKRAMELPDLRVLRNEYRFYSEMAQCSDSPLSPRLAGALRLPQVLAACLGPEGWEAEGFVLVLECLAGPEWKHVKPEDGLSEPQALATAATLGRMHAAFVDSRHPQSLERYPWLPLTPLDIKPGDTGLQQQYFGCLIRSGEELKVLLPPAVAGWCVKMLKPDSFVKLLGRMAEPPLTLIHGDFRTENLRFSHAKLDGPESASDIEVAAFDWGMVSRGRGALDLAYFLALSLAPEERRQLEDRLVEEYLAPFDESLRPTKAGIWDDLCVSILCLLGKLVLAYADFHGPQHALDMLDRSLRWAGAAAEDWNAGRILD